MSSILKALRRLEEERARKSHVAPEIAASLLRGESRRQKSSVWLWPSVFVLVVLIMALFLWSWRPGAVTSPIVLHAPSPATIPIPVSTGGGGEVIIEEIMDQRRPAPLPLGTPAFLPAKSIPPEPRIAPGVTARSVTNKPPVLVIEERQSPVVSAIAWQDDSAACMAVVDGLPVMTGESVATAKVVEIQPDRILFEEEGVRFIVRLHSP